MKRKTKNNIPEQLKAMVLAGKKAKTRQENAYKILYTIASVITAIEGPDGVLMCVEDAIQDAIDHKGDCSCQKQKPYSKN